MVCGGTASSKIVNGVDGKLSGTQTTGLFWWKSNPGAYFNNNLSYDGSSWT